MEKLAFRSAETHGALRDSNEQPFLYQWEEAVPWKSRDKISKHDTTSFVMDNEGAIKVEFPTWLETITLPDEKTQYLLALTEEGIKSECVQGNTDDFYLLAFMGSICVCF